MTEFAMRSRRRRAHPTIVALMVAMGIAAERRGQNARTTIGGLHQVALTDNILLEDLEQLYIDAIVEDAPGYGIPGFEKAVRLLWMDCWISSEVKLQADLKDSKKAFELTSDDVDRAFNAMLKQEGMLVRAPQQDQTTGYEFKTWVRPSTYLVS